MITNNFQLDFVENAEIVMEQFQRCLETALTEIGTRVEAYASALAPTDTGTLKNSITFKVIENEVFVGTPVFYAPYVEYGTGKFASSGNGREGWWVFVKNNKNDVTPKDDTTKVYTKSEALKIYFALKKKASKGDADFSEDDVWITQGQKPVHFLLKAVTEHDEEYKNVLRKSFHF